MSDFLELKEDVKEIKRDVKEISQTLVRNTVSLELHEARTTASEKRIETMEKWLLGLLGSILLAVITKIFI